MKKIILRILLIICLFYMNNVDANVNLTLKQDYIEGVFFTRRGGGKPYESFQYRTFSIDNKTVYCIEPGIEIITNSYIAYDKLNESPFDDKINKKIELIGYYGYDYNGHQTLKYRMATQALIWEETGGQIVEFWTQRYGYGNYINIDSEKNEIMKLVNNHLNVSSFNGMQYNLILGDAIELVDNNNVLNDFEFIKNDNIDLSISDNKLSIKANKNGKFELIFKKKKYDDTKSIIYIGSNSKSQKMAYFRYSDDVKMNLTLNVIGGCIKLNKNDYETKTNNSISTYASLANAKYGIYTMDDKLISTIITNNEGYTESEKNLSIGRYYLKEISPSIGYNLDNEKYFFEITKDNLIIDLKVYEKIIVRQIIIKKYIKNIKDNELQLESNVKFNIYDKNNKLIKEVITNNEGIAKFELFYGSYIIKQINSSVGYQRVNDLKIEINESCSEGLEYSLIDLPIEVKIKVNKKDYDTKNNIQEEGITFKIKNKDKNEYICYKDINNKLTCDYKTNSNGEFITTNYLTYGNYQIEEINAPNGYILNKEPFCFKINENTNIVNDINGNYVLIDLYNKSIKGSIQIKKYGEVLKINNDNFNYENVPLKDVTFSLYAKDDIVFKDGTILYKKGSFIKRLRTDKFGIVIFDELNLGNYYVKETETINGYEIDKNEYYFTLNEIEYNKSIEMYNKLIKNDVKIIKKDVDTLEGIPNTLISIYNTRNECLESNLTDQKGEVYINDLPLGRYYIKEVKSAKGYKLNSDVIEFEIKEKNEIMEFILYNKKEIIIVPNTSVNNEFSKMLIFIFIVIGTICLCLAKKINIQYNKK